MHYNTSNDTTRDQTDHIVEARGLWRRYGSFEAVKGIDFHIRRGECFGFLGPNGAGKTSTIRMLTCRIPVSEGRLTLFDIPVEADPARIKSRMGIVAQEDNLDEALTVRENLTVYARYFHIPRAEAERRADELLRLMELESKQDVRPTELSGGLKRRLAIARALVSDPELVVLDEPTTGLDPQARLVVWEQLLALKEKGVTLLLTTHYMEEAARLCDRLVMMDQGEIKVEGTPRTLVQERAGAQVVEALRWEGDLDGVLTPGRSYGANGVSPAQAADGDGGDGTVGEAAPDDGRRAALQRHLVVGQSRYLYTDDPAALLRWLSGRGVELVEYESRPASLEDVFLELTGKGLDAGNGADARGERGLGNE